MVVFFYTTICFWVVVVSVGMESVLENVERGNEDLTLASLLAYNEEVCILFMELCMAYVFGLEENT